MLAGKLGDLDWYETRELKGGISTFPALINGKVSAAKIICVLNAYILGYTLSGKQSYPLTGG